MNNTHIDSNKVEHQVEKRQKFHMGVLLHFSVFVVVNLIVWAIWLLIPNKADSFPAIPLIITGAWTVILIVHSVLVGVSHSPGEVRHDEIKREVQKEHIER